MNSLLTKKKRLDLIANFFRRIFFSPITEEGLLIGVSIVIILILLGLIFGIFNWITGSISALFEQLGVG